MQRSLIAGILEILLTLLGLVWLVSLLIFGNYGPWLLATWNIAAIAYIVVGWLLLRGRIPDGEDERSAMRTPRWQSILFALVVSIAGLAGGMVTLATRGEDNELLLQSNAVATILLSWMLLHTAYAQIYARDYYSCGGLDFPNCDLPQLTEFVYFSITIGTSFAVSDVTITSRRIRRLVIGHSVLSFFFNAAVVAIALDWIKSS